MKSMLAAFMAIALIGVGAHFSLHALELSAQEVYSGPAVRVD